MKIRNITSFLIVLVLGVAVSSCDSGSKVNEFEVLRAHIADLMSTSALKKIAPASTVNGTSNQIIDIRAASGDTGTVDTLIKPGDSEKPGYAEGYISGAINIPYSSNITTTANLDQVNSGEAVYLHCYTSNTGSMAATILNILGYEVYNMKWGMMAYNNWNTSVDTNSDGAPDDQDGMKDMFTATKASGTSNDTGADSNTDTFSYPSVATGNKTAAAIAKAQYAKILTSSITTKASSVKTIVDSWTTESANYQIVSVRSGVDYAAGHIPNAINIPYANITDTDQLARLDPSKKIIVYCYTGHTGGIATAVLRLLGYDAVNMMFGFDAWEDSTSYDSADATYSLITAP